MMSLCRWVKSGQTSELKDKMKKISLQRRWRVVRFHPPLSLTSVLPYCSFINSRLCVNEPAGLRLLCRAGEAASLLLPIWINTETETRQPSTRTPPRSLCIVSSQERLSVNKSGRSTLQNLINPRLIHTHTHTLWLNTDAVQRRWCL